MPQPLKIDESKARVIRRWWKHLCDEYASERTRALGRDEILAHVRCLKRKNISLRLIALLLGESVGVIARLCATHRIRLTGRKKYARNRYISRDLKHYCS